MDNATLHAAMRRFPLLGRPRPDCPPLPLRIKELTDTADAALHKLEHGIPDAAHALNKAALIASDAGMTNLAHQLCWQHIDTYLRVDRPLTNFEVRCLLEPVLNLARLQIRTDQGTPALLLLKDMYDAITHRTNLTIEGRTLPTANLACDQAERRKLREWAWLQLLGEGIRIHALANRWTDAADHARAHNGIGNHLMEGRQALIIAECAQGRPADGRKILAETTLTQPWEQQVASALHLLCAQPNNTTTAHLLATAIRRLATHNPTTNYASYHARLGITVALLASSTQPAAAKELLHRTAQQAISSADGYAARDMLGFRDPLEGIDPSQTAALNGIAQRAGLGLGQLPDAALQNIAITADTAVKVLDIALG